MNAAQQIRELKSARRNSARAIPVYAGFLVLAATGLWLVQHLGAFPMLVAGIVLGVTAFTLAGDLINYFVCGRRLMRLQAEQDK
jgi:hypothetical protein